MERKNCDLSTKRILNFIRFLYSGDSKFNLAQSPSSETSKSSAT